MKYKIMLLLVLSECLYGYVEQHVAITRDRSARLKQGSLSPEHLNISNCDFREAGPLLKDIHLSGITAASTNFGLYHNKKSHQLSKGPTDLTGANFSLSYVGSANFEGCILKHANFSGANVIKVNFANTDLTGANFKGAQNIDLAVFRGATMPDGKPWTEQAWKSNRSAMFKVGK